MSSDNPLGCVVFVLAVFLAVVLWNITPEFIDFLEAQLGGAAQ